MGTEAPPASPSPAPVSLGPPAAPELLGTPSTPYSPRDPPRLGGSRGARVRGVSGKEGARPHPAAGKKALPPPGHPGSRAEGPAAPAGSPASGAPSPPPANRPGEAGLRFNLPVLLGFCLFVCFCWWIRLALWGFLIWVGGIFCLFVFIVCSLRGVCRAQHIPEALGAQGAAESPSPPPMAGTPFPSRASRSAGGGE